MKKFKVLKKLATCSLLLTCLAIPTLASAGTSTVSVGNGSFKSYASSSNLGLGVKSVTGISTAVTNISKVKSKAAHSNVVEGKVQALSTCNSLSSNLSYDVTNTGISTSGATKSHSQRQ